MRAIRAEQREKDIQERRSTFQESAFIRLGEASTTAATTSIATTSTRAQIDDRQRGRKRHITEDDDPTEWVELINDSADQQSPPEVEIIRKIYMTNYDDNVYIVRGGLNPDEANTKNWVWMMTPAGKFLANHRFFLFLIRQAEKGYQTFLKCLVALSPCSIDHPSMIDNFFEIASNVGGQYNWLNEMGYPTYPGFNIPC